MVFCVVEMLGISQETSVSLIRGFVVPSLTIAWHCIC